MTSKFYLTKTTLINTYFIHEAAGVESKTVEEHPLTEHVHLIDGHQQRGNTCTHDATERETCAFRKTGASCKRFYLKLDLYFWISVLQ